MKERYVDREEILCNYSISMIMEKRFHSAVQLATRRSKKA